MRIGLIVVFAAWLSGCTTLHGAPATINSPLDWALAYLERNTDQNRYYIQGEISRLLKIMESAGEFTDTIAYTQQWYTPLRTASELQQKYLELKETLHQHYLTTGRY